MKRAHIIPMTNGDEYDALTRWRHFLHWKPGTRKAIKRGYSRRQRTMGRTQLRRDVRELVAV
ncbi:MAG: hypothetical protein HY847_11910 [Betaproteobacteria bacterium]|nr:hypothetical protein [Betaproteobacteria bacterium]